MEQTINAAVIGVGRMGRHHARVLAGLPGVRLVGVVDVDEDRAAMAADEFGGLGLTRIEALFEAAPDLGAASVAVPTRFHAQAARPLLERGVACLIEKPLAPTAEQAKAIVELARQHNALLQVGHTERFNPVVRALTTMQLAPRFMEVHRVSPMTFRSLDVGVVMDIMIHDLDIVLMFAKSPLARVDASGVAVLGEHEDVANARLVFENGCVANLTASRLALKTERKLRLFSEEAYASLDYHKQAGVLIRKAANDETLAKVRDQIARGADLSDVDYAELVQVENLDMAQDASGQPAPDPLTAELTAFMDSIRSGKPAVVDGAAGHAAIDAAQRVVAAIKAHRWDGLPGSRV